VGGLEGNARFIPGALAVVQGRRLRTYEDLNARANQFGNALLSLRVRRSERLALLLTNRIGFLECSYGCWKDALVSVPVNYRFQDAELRHVLENADSVGVVVEATFLPTIQHIRDQLPLLRSSSRWTMWPRIPNRGSTILLLAALIPPLWHRI
jgi:fatty-acyl-CoA synthase